MTNPEIATSVRTGAISGRSRIGVVTKAPLRGPGCHVGSEMAAIDFVTESIAVAASGNVLVRFHDLESVSMRFVP